jgi:bifunctional isochorismate lyase/aryl carrier protein
VALQRVSPLAAGADAERDRRNQLIITGVYAHIGCMTTATDAFMRDIKPFFVADALADFSREEHLMSLKYVAGRSGRVVMTDELLPPPASKAALRALILPLLDESDEPMDDENLIDYGLDSVRMMALPPAGAKCTAISTS